MWLSSLTDVAQGVGHLLFPNGCLVCATPEGDRTDFRHGVCNDCLRAVVRDDFAACPRCAATVGPHTDVSKGCAACRDVSLGFDAAIRLGSYEGKLRDAILRMKHHSGEGLADVMGRVFWETSRERFRASDTDLVVPVPLHWRRRFWRGYNQAAAVARELASVAEMEYAPWALFRVRHTHQQSQPSAAARRENVLGAFRAAPHASIAGRSVLLVDDVMTTGSTVAEAGRTLRTAGAKRVVVAVLARR